MRRKNKGSKYPISLNDVFREYLYKSQYCMFNVIYGSVRTGKDYMSTPAFIERIRQVREPSVFLVAARSVKLAHSIVGDYILKYAGVYAQLEYDPSGSSYISLKTQYCTHKILLVGAANRGSDREIQGLTIHGAYLTEVTLLDEDFIDQCLKRIATYGREAFIFTTSNPDRPNHPFYNRLKLWIKESEKDESYLNLLHVTLEDGPVMTPELIKTLKSGKDPNSVSYKRDILGLDCDPDGAMFNFTDDNLLNDYDIKDYLEYIIVIDPGETNSATAISTVGLYFNKETKQKELHVLKEWHHRNNNVPEAQRMTPNQYATRIAEYISDSTNEFKKLPNRIYLDGTLYFRQLVTRELLKYKIVNQVLYYPIKEKETDRVAPMQNMIYDRRLKIYKTCVMSIEDLKNAQYDKNAYERTGEIKRLGKFDDLGHGDNIDNIEYAVSHFKTKI